MKRKRAHLLSAVMLFCLIGICSYYPLSAQNPNWIMPGWNFQPGTDYIPLPQSPINPWTGNPNTNPQESYQGGSSDAIFSGYTGYDGELMMFVIDGRVYDKDGWVVNNLRLEDGSGGSQHQSIKGTNEMLVLPMGNSCKRFAVIYPASTTNAYHPSVIDMDILYGIYDVSASNNFSPVSTGAMVGEGSNGYGPTLSSVKEDFFDNHSGPGSPYLFNWFRSGYHVSASKLINNCFRYVWICDSEHIIRYKLDEFGLHYDNYQIHINDFPADQGGGWRTEMELVQPSDSTYRIAVPTSAGSNPNVPGAAIHVLDFDASMNLIPNTHKILDLGIDASNLTARPHGIEFDATGRYVYFTHRSNGNLPNSLDVWDVEADVLVTPTLPPGISAFENSFIERYGEELYFVKDGYIGRISNASTPGAVSFGINQNYQQIGLNFGNDMGQGPGAFRYILPDQVDDDSYGNFDEFSCACCREFGASGTLVDEVITSSSETWSPSDNPFNDGTGAEVTIRDELRIAAGADINIEGMTFYFKPGARVVIERGSGSVRGAMLTLRNSVFTLDFSCVETTFGECTPPILNAPQSVNPEIPEEKCEDYYWKGVELQGYAEVIQPVPTWNFADKPTFNFSLQGKFYMYADSKIEFAETGLTVGSQSESGYGGGVAMILESTFKDNITGIDFHPYSWISSGNELKNVSRILDTHFLTTSEFLTGDQEFSPWAFVELTDVSNIDLLGNRYENETTVNGDASSGNGVMLGDAGARIGRYCGGAVSIEDPCPQPVVSQFKGLHHGVSGRNSGSNRKLEVLACDFERNTIGVSISSFINPDIVDCRFMIPREDDCFGISLITSTGYGIEGNSFSHVAGSGFPESAGIFIEASGDDFNYIYRNSFTDLRFGVVSRGQNVNTQNYAEGLKYRCNVFDFPIRTADIYLMHGNISAVQGICFGSQETAAGNFFSHTSNHPNAANHKDIRVSSSGITPSNFIMMYRHHQTPPDRLEPIAYTIGRVVPVECSSPYDGSNSCPVIKTTEIGGGGAGPKSNGGGDDDIWTLNEIEAMAQQHEDNVSAAAAELDGGHTEEILEMIYQGAPLADISALVAEAGNSLTNTVLTALAGSENEDYEALAAQSAGLSASSLGAASGQMPTLSDVAVSTNAYENDWKAARENRALFWKNVVDFYQTDTAGILTASTMAGLLDQYKPQSLQRFASNFAQKTGLVNSDWVRSYNATDYTDFGGLALPALTEEGLLPYHLPEHSEQGFFSNFGNVAALNDLYIEHDQVYGPHIAGYIEDFGGGDGAKSNDGGKAEGEAIVATYPNPFTDVITFEIADRDLSYDKLELRIFDVTGRSVWSEVYGADAKTIMVDGRQFPKGLLIYSVFMDGELIENGKVLRME